MDQQKIIDSIEGITALVGSIVPGIVAARMAAIAIRGIIGLALGKDLSGEEYAQATERGLARNQQSLVDRIDAIDGDN